MVDEAGAEEVRILRECVDKTLEAVEDLLDEARESHGHGPDEAMLYLRRHFEGRAMQLVGLGDERRARADYATYCGAMVALSEARREVARLREDVAFRDSVIEAMDVLGEM